MVRKAERTIRQKVEALLDGLYRDFIRRRAMLLSGGCQRCPSKRRSYQGLETAHCHSRTNRTVRWDKRNGAGVCGECHDYIDTHRDAKQEFFRKLLGDEGYEALRVLAVKTTKEVPIDYKQKEMELKALLTEIEE